MQQYPRSPKVLLGGMAHLARFLDKIRMRHAGLIQDYNYITVGFDKYLLDFLQIKGEDFEKRVLQGVTDAEILAWVKAHARPLTDEDIRQWNERILNGGPKDEAARQRFQARRAEIAAKRGVPAEPVRIVDRVHKRVHLHLASIAGPGVYLADGQRPAKGSRLPAGFL